MCANYRPSALDLVNAMLKEPIIEQYPVETWPGGLAPMIRLDRDTGELIGNVGRFGLLPHFAKDVSYCRNTYNARSETIAEKPSFKMAWRKAHFCLIPVCRLFEPCYKTGKPVRWSISMVDGIDFAVGGIWSRWMNPANDTDEWSFTMVTLNAEEHPLMKQFHKPAEEKRMPLILRSENYMAWLSATPAEVNDLIQAIPAQLLTAEAAPLASRKQASAHDLFQLK